MVTYYYILFHIITTHPPWLDFVFGRWKVNGNSQGPHTFRHPRQVVTSESYVRKTSLLDMSAERQVGAMSYDVMDMWLGQLGQLDIVDMDITWDIYYILCIIYILYISSELILADAWSWSAAYLDVSLFLACLTDMPYLNESLNVFHWHLG